MEISPEILKRYASGECTDEERALVENWILSESDIPADMDWEKAAKLQSDIWVELSADFSEASPKPAAWLHRYPQFVRLGTAASILIAMVCGLLLLENSSNSLHAEESNREIHRWVKSRGTIPINNPDTGCVSDNALRPLELQAWLLTRNAAAAVPDAIETYYAIRFQKGSDQAVIFSSEELSRFTPMLWRRIVSINQLS